MDAEDSLLRRLRLLVALSVYAAVYLAALAYPFRLRDSVLEPLEMLDPATLLGWLYHEQFRSALVFAHHPLMYKESVASGLLILALCGLLTLKLVGAARSQARARSLREHLGSPTFWALAFLGWCAATVFLISETFNYSLRTVLLMLLGMAVYWGVLVTARSQRAVHKFFLGTCICGIVVAAVTLMQHLGLARGFMPEWGEAEYRNRVGSLIGHNTGMSAYMLFPVSFGGYLALAARSRVVRAAGLAAVVLGLMAIVAGQSRAVWALLLLGLPAFTIGMSRAFGRQVGPRVLLAGFALLVLVVASQTVAPRYNPLARHAYPLVQRVKEHILNPQQLLAETRLRIVVCSLPLVARSPLWGYGIGTFQYEYPLAQGEYFTRHPDTRLVPTSKRTDFAHNDYLQLLVEVGLIGCILAGAALFLVVRLGVRGWRRLGPGAGRAAQVALVVPVGCIALHALIDFPMHIIPIGLLVVASLAFYVKCPDLYGAAATVLEAEPDEEVEWVPRVRPAKVAIASALGCAVVLAPFAYVYTTRHFMSDIFRVDGGNWVTSMRLVPPSNLRERAQFLENGIGLLRKSIHVNPFNGEAYEAIAFALSNLALIHYNVWQQRSRQATTDAEKTRAEEQRKLAELNATAAIRFLRTGEIAGTRQVGRAAFLGAPVLRPGELRYHNLYHMLGQGYLLMGRLNPETPEYMKSALDAFTAAIRMNIADLASAAELADLLERQSPPRTAEAIEVRKRIAKMDPVFFRLRYLDSIYRTMDATEWEDASARLARVERGAPGVEPVVVIRAELEMRRAYWPRPDDVDASTTGTLRLVERERDLSGLKAALEAVPPEFAGNLVIQRLRALTLFADGETTAALALVSEARRSDPSDFPLMALEAVMQQLSGQIAPALTTVLDHRFWQQVQYYRMLLMDDRWSPALQVAAMSQTVRIDRTIGLLAFGLLQMGGEEWKEYSMRMMRGLARENPADDFIQELFVSVHKFWGVELPDVGLPTVPMTDVIK